MRSRNAGILLGICLLLMACSPRTGKQLAEKPPAVPSEEILEPVHEVEVEEEAPDPLPELILSFRRMPCYGKCPSYEVKLYSDGKLDYQGEEHVKWIGNFTTQISQDLIFNIYERAANANFFALSDKYPPTAPMLTDLPQTITYLKQGELEQQIVNNYEAPPALLEFEQYLENLFENQSWKVLSDPARGNR